MSENGKYIEIAGGKITETYTHDIEFFAGRNIVTSAAKFINEQGEDKGMRYGEPKEYEPVNPNIVKLEFLDENDNILKQEILAAFGNIQATNFFMGKKVKIKITTKDVADGTIIPFSLKGTTKSTSQKFIGLDKQKWNGTIKGNSFETPLFELDNLWFSEDLENYNYGTHKTEIGTDDVNSFYVTGNLNARPFELPPHPERLKPVMYLRNYEELIGLFHTNDTGDKDLVKNYENKFILRTQLESILVNFSKFIYQTKDISIPKINTRVEQDAKLLWDTAVRQVQSGNLDDRPLYWTRLKMQVHLKQHYLFENDIDFKTSIVKKGTELEKTIQLFEEKSRNYDGIDFSKAGSKKKVLITGFDPFVINPFHPNIPGKNDRQNPSGISVLNFHGKTVGNAYIQCAMIPVRYEDFDNGIIEKLVEDYIGVFDIMMTMSKNDANFDIERFACKFRGGFLDNVNIGFGVKSYNSSRFKQIPNGNEFYETTLPISKILVDDLDVAKLPTKVFFDQSYKDDLGNLENHPTDKTNSITKKPIIISGKSIDDSGSGGDYLSNEIMYRSTRKRDEMGFNKSKGIGHIHISSSLKSQKILDLLTKIITNASK